ncbi:unnamed protein product, partial [Owenia fusiformis]
TWTMAKKLEILLLFLFIHLTVLFYVDCDTTSQPERYPVCRRGKFGWNCHFTCNCTNGASCDSFTGKCDFGSTCDGLSWGWGCILSSSCYYDRQKGRYYIGCLNTTKFDTPCQAWSKDTPQEHHYHERSYFPEGDPEIIRHNLCRNPNKYLGLRPWCYRDSEFGRKTYGYCNISKCECPDFTYGRNCVKECHCNDPNEVCDRILGGACHRSGCDVGWSGVDCQTANRSSIPRPYSPPSLQQRGKHFIQVTWEDDAPDAYSYIIESKSASNVTWFRHRKAGKYRREFRLDGLTIGETVQFRMIAINRNSLLSFPGPVAVLSTCSAPSTGPRAVELTTYLDINDASQARIHVKWQAPSWRVVNCESILLYRVYYKTRTETDFTLYKDVGGSENSVNISGLDTCTLYDIAVAIINNGHLEGRNSSHSSIQTVMGRPGAVMRLFAQAVSASQLRVFWSANVQQNCNIRGYMLQYKLLQELACDQTNDTAWSQTFSTSDEQYLLIGLEAYSRYSIKVWASSSNGNGPAKVINNAETSSGGPWGMPVNVAAKNVTSESALLTWAPPPCNERNGLFKNYQYRLTNLNYSDIDIQRTGIVSSEFHTYKTFSNLIPYSTYVFEVNFENDKQPGLYSEIIFRTHPSTPGQVKTVSSAHGKQTYSSISIQWVAPYPPKGRIMSYDIKFKTTEGRAEFKKIIGSETRVVIGNLCPGTEYQIWVRAATREGAGEWSEDIWVSTSPGAPSDPESLRNVSRSSTSLKLEWMEPARCAFIVRSYQVQCMIPSLPFLQSRPTTESQPQQYEVSDQHQMFTNLQPGSEYVCQVVAKSNFGDSHPVEIKVWTLPASPPDVAAPDLVSVSETSVILQLQPFQAHQHNLVDKYQVVVRRVDSDTIVSRRRRSLANEELSDFATAKENGLNYYIAAEIRKDQKDLFAKPIEFTLGDGKFYGIYYNAPLEKGGQYNISVGALNSADGVTFSKYTQLPVLVLPVVTPPPPGSNNGVIAAIVTTAILLILLIVAIAFIFYKRRQQPKKDYALAERDESLISTASKPSASESAGDLSEMLPLTGDVESDSEPLYSNYDIHKAIKIDDLWQHIQTNRESKDTGFKQEYQKLPAGLKAKTEMAKAPGNKGKNRYANIVAYDHSRVILEKLEDDPHSDYINGNYIDGYKKSKTYIATQGPSPLTKNDIWRLAWQQDASVIVMVTNLIEDGRKKCEQYWPDTEEGAGCYGEITVQPLQTQRFSDFVFRKFTISKGQEKKSVTQCHFIGWPDHGTPAYATALLQFRRKVLECFQANRGPMIVHCSAGVGRTGTFISLDYLIQQGEKEDKVDIFSCVHLMRTQRVNMVQTLDQYIFVHSALLEHFKCGDTTIKVGDLVNTYTVLCDKNPITEKSWIEEQFELMTLMSPTRSRRSMTMSGLEPQNEDKNRDKAIVPGDHCRPFLSTQVDGLTDYINAVFIDGYRRKYQYLLTQMPLPSTVIDFWRMVYDHKSSTIVMLNELDKNDETCVAYWPESPGEQKYGPFTIELTDLDNSLNDVIIRQFNITCSCQSCSFRGKAETKTICQFQLTRWPKDSDLPQSEDAMLTLIEAVNKWQPVEKPGPITIHCMNGASRSGLYCALSYSKEKQASEKEVDIFQAVKHVRINRPELVNSLSQYQYCYQVALRYMEKTEEEANTDEVIYANTETDNNSLYMNVG